MDTQFVRDRITQLRLKKGVSEYQMSYDLGHSRSYVYNISSGKSLPPIAEFLQISSGIFLYNAHGACAGSGFRFPFFIPFLCCSGTALFNICHPKLYFSNLNRFL